MCGAASIRSVRSTVVAAAHSLTFGQGCKYIRRSSATAAIIRTATACPNSENSIHARIRNALANHVWLHCHSGPNIKLLRSSCLLPAMTTTEAAVPKASNGRRIWGLNMACVLNLSFGSRESRCPFCIHTHIISTSDMPNTL